MGKVTCKTMDLLAGYDSDASGSGSDMEAQLPQANSNAPPEKQAGKLVLPPARDEIPDSKPGVKKVNLKSLASLLPPPKTGETHGKRGAESDEEGEEPLWKRLKAAKPSGLSLMSMLPKPMHDDGSANRGKKLEIGAASTTVDASADVPPPAAVAPEPAVKPRREEAAAPTVSAPSTSTAPAASAAPKKVKIDFGGPSALKPSAAPPPMASLGTASLRPPLEAAPSARAGYVQPTHAAAQYAVSAFGGYTMPSAAISYQDSIGPAPVTSDLHSAAAQVPAPAPSGFTLPAEGLDRHMRKALGTGAVPGMESVSIAAISTQWDPRSIEGQKKEKVEIQSKHWSAAAGEVIQSNKPNRLQNKKHQINSLAFQVPVTVARLLVVER